jgi:hypothetical protein
VAATSVLDVAEAFVDIGRSAQRHIPAEFVTDSAWSIPEHDDFDRLWQADAGAGRRMAAANLSPPEVHHPPEVIGFLVALPVNVRRFLPRHATARPF